MNWNSSENIQANIGKTIFIEKEEKEKYTFSNKVNNPIKTSFEKRKKYTQSTYKIRQLDDISLGGWFHSVE